LTRGQKCILHFTKYKIDSGFVDGCGCSQGATQTDEQKWERRILAGPMGLLDRNAVLGIRPEGGKGFVYQDQDVTD
jgi:hypothetical protein